eukprot:TRINITY_DN14132_c0_g1_i1.p1 TRINITY_DN14132_c0_g1~~TRINITY_DN14132_c0_g1_i1.p1  ORF type:complete len:738 (+),score=190.13 TRINITY_DN14132_c0_g1_i1:22-2214(+)
MDLNFVRHDILTVASTNRNCIRVLPLGKKNKQKIAVGDTTGTVQAFSLGKANELTQSFTYNVAAEGAPKKPVSCMDLFADKIFVAAGEAISGVNRKGKSFFRLETNLSETVNNMTIKTPFIWTAGDYVLNLFEEGKEAHFYMSPDKIHGILVDHIVSDKVFDAALACHDRMIRVVKESDLLGEFPVEGSAKSLQIYSAKSSVHRDLIYGTDNGVLGAYKISPGGLQKKWDTSAQLTQPGAQTSGFNCILCSDFLKDGVTEIVCGRDNGLIEIYSFDANPEPNLVYQTTLNEMVTGMDVGLITNPSKEELVISTYSGKILCFSTFHEEQAPPPAPTATAATSSTAVKQAEVMKKKNEKKVAHAAQEVEKLKEKLAKKKEEYSKISEDHIAVSAEYKIRDKFVLDASACWVLTIELDCPIEVVALQCDVDVELLDMESNGAISSKSKPEADSGTKLLASFRNTESTNRMEIKLRTVEGQYGTLQAFIIPLLSPKTAQLASYQVRPLSLHQRLSDAPSNLDQIPLNSLNIQGTFTVNDMNTWVGSCLPEVPERINSEEATYYFRSTFQGTTLVAKYRANDATFRSDNLSTLAILKEFITKQATSRKIQVKIKDEIKDETCPHVLALLHPQLQYQLGLSEKVKLIEALKEIEMQEQDIGFLSPAYKETLERARIIEKEFELQPRRLEFLHGIVKNLYLDKFKFRGQNATAKLPLLLQHLEHYDLKDLQEFFMQN